MLTTRLFSLWVYCLLAAAPFVYGQPSITVVVNGASFEPAVAPGSLVVIYGKGLASSTLSSPGLPLPMDLGGTSVQIGGVAAGLYYVSDTQVNAVVPPATPAGGTVSVVVTSASGPSQTFKLKVDQCAPAIFTQIGNGLGRAIVFSTAYSLLDQVTPGQTISFYATGLGASAAGQDGYSRAVVTPSVNIGESQAVVLFAGPSGYPGVYQVNAVVPSSLASERFYMSSAPAPYLSNVAEIGIPAGKNTLNASGDIHALYPLPTSTITFSQVLMAAKFNARFDAAPGAVPFTVAAVSDASSIVFVVDPVTRRITGRSRMPTALERFGDFSQSSRNPGFSVVDFLSGGIPMPGNIVPLSRLDPVARAAWNSMPLPNALGSELTNFLYGNDLPSSGTVVLDDSSGTNAFGYFLSIPYAPYLASRSARFRLYIDGKLMASDNLTYSLTTPAAPPGSVSLKDIILAAASVPGGNPVQGTVNLTGSAPAGGVVVALQSDNAAAVTAASVTVAAGQSSAQFTLTTKTVTSYQTATITAKLGSDSKTAALTVTPPA